MARDVAKKNVLERQRQRQRRSNPAFRYDESQRKRRERASRKKSAVLVEAPTHDVKLGDLDAPDIRDEWVAEAIARSFNRATGSWSKANPSRGHKGWGNDLRATRSISKKREGAYDDGRDYDTPAAGRRAGSPPEDGSDDEAFVIASIEAVGYLERANQQGRPQSEDEVTFYILQRDSRPSPSRNLPSTILDGEFDERNWQALYRLRLRRVEPRQRRVGNVVEAPPSSHSVPPKP